MRKNLLLPAAILTLAAVGAQGAPATAAHSGVGRVTACSADGNWGCVTAQVRRGALGLEYRTKGGSWEDCAGDCQDTLRRATVDFWQDQEGSDD